MPSNFDANMAFTVDDLKLIVSEGWGRFSGQPGQTSSPQNWRSPGLFGQIQRRRSHLFKLPEADPVLPTEMGEYPHFQSDFLRQKHWEFVSRLLENRFTIDATPSPGTQKARELADKAEWVMTYGAASIQERTGVDWQRSLAEGASAYCYGVLHWRMAPELSAATPDGGYLDDLPDDETAKNYQPTSESIGGDASKGKYRETAASVSSRSAIAKSRSPFPMHVEVIAPDQVVFIDDESDEPGSGMVIHFKEVGIIDYNGELAKNGLRLKATGTRQSNIKLALEEYAPGSEVGLEHPAPTAQFLPSIAGWKQRIGIVCVWSRGEYYEMVSPTLLPGGSSMIINQVEWVLTKGKKHGYGRCPFVRAYATVEENEWDPALRYLPAQAGVYATKSAFDYSRALWDRIATQIAVQRYFIEQDVDAPPTLAGDEEGDQVILTRDSAEAQVLPPGQHLEPVGPTDISPAFAKTLEMQTQELENSSPPTGQTPISATTQPWNLRIGQVMANAYPALVLDNISKALVEMFRNWMELAEKPAEEGGLGVPLVAPGFSRVGRGGKKINRGATPITMEAGDWDGIWLDVKISPVSSAERVTQIQMGQQLLNNPIHVTTPEMFVSDDLGVQDATGHMKEVDAFWAIQPFMQGLTNQTLATYYGKQVLVGADGVMANGLGQQVDPNQVLAQNGVKPANAGGISGGQNTQGDTATAPGPLPAPNMPPLPTLETAGASPLPGMA